MIRPIAPTHKAATDRAERIKRARQELDSARLATLKDNLALLLVVLFLTSCSILTGLFIASLIT